jgi:hypothetical protein
MRILRAEAEINPLVRQAGEFFLTFQRKNYRKHFTGGQGGIE